MHQINFLSVLYSLYFISVFDRIWYETIRDCGFGALESLICADTHVVS